MMKLNQEEECLLIHRAQQGDERAFERLLEEYKPTISYIAWRYRQTGADLEELCAAGAVGLWKAIKRFDLSRRTKPSTYFYRGIDLAVRNQLRELYPISNDALSHWREVHRARSELFRIHEQEPAPEKIAEKTGVPLDVVNEILVSGSRMVSATGEARDPAPSLWFDHMALYYKTVFRILQSHTKAQKYLVLFSLAEKTLVNYTWNTIADYIRDATAAIGVSTSGKRSLWILICGWYQLPRQIPRTWERIAALFSMPPPTLTYVEPGCGQKEFLKARDKTSKAVRKFYSRAIRALDKAEAQSGIEVPAT